MRAASLLIYCALYANFSLSVTSSNIATRHYLELSLIFRPPHLILPTREKIEREVSSVVENFHYISPFLSSVSAYWNILYLRWRKDNQMFNYFLILNLNYDFFCVNNFGQCVNNCSFLLIWKYFLILFVLHFIYKRKSS